MSIPISFNKLISEKELSEIQQRAWQGMSTQERRFYQNIIDYDLNQCDNQDTKEVQK